MQLQPISIYQIAKQIHSRRIKGEMPYLLFLGAGVSISSGVPGMADLIDKFLIDFGVAGIDKSKDIDADRRFEIFTSEMENLSKIDRYTWLIPSFENARPSNGYLELANLIEKGYFDLIFTTNWDDFLDVTLEESSQLKGKRDYRFYVRGVDQDDFITRSCQEPIPHIKILKLHGELISRVILVTPEETSTFPNDLSNYLKNLFKQRDLIMIGYSASDLAIQKCIDQKNDKTLIYINPNQTLNKSASAFISNFGFKRQLSGQDAEFDTFISKLRETISSEEKIVPQKK